MKKPPMELGGSATTVSSAPSGSGYFFFFAGLLLLDFFALPFELLELFLVAFFMD